MPPTVAPVSNIGTVFPTRDIRAALYVDAMLGKHFALLGSTGTGKSTSAALILHRICEHGARRPYRDGRSARRIFAAFKQPAMARFDVNNLPCPIG
jgi:transcriptional regulator with AAA-type ATPase domain